MRRIFASIPSLKANNYFSGAALKWFVRRPLEAFYLGDLYERLSHHLLPQWTVSFAALVLGCSDDSYST
jgi:hypothetical protein